MNLKVGKRRKTYKRTLSAASANLRPISAPSEYRELFDLIRKKLGFKFRTDFIVHLIDQMVSAEVTEKGFFDTDFHVVADPPFSLDGTQWKWVQNGAFWVITLRYTENPDVLQSSDRT